MMITKRNYFIMVIIMGITLMLFQFSQWIRDYGNDYSTNPYTEIKVPDRHVYEQTVASVGDNVVLEDEYILFLGKLNTNIGSIVNQWTLYSKRDLLLTEKLSNFSSFAYGMPGFVLIDAQFVDFAKDVPAIKSFTDNGVSIVFLNLPDPAIIEKDKTLADLMGISYIKEKSVTVEGVKLFGGFMFGGETIYKPEKKNEEKRQDLKLEMPWYITGGGTKTYIVGMMDEYYNDYEYKNDLFPAIVWRNSFGKAQVFCVNGNFMSDTAGLGLLSSMVYELSNFQLYPVVNAQNTLVIDFPLMADENDEEFERIYSRPVSAFQMDVIWPTLVKFAENDKIQYTCFMAPKYDYSDPAQPEYDKYESFLKMFAERKTEVGLSLEHEGGISLLEKLDFDKQYYDLIEKKYQSTSAFMDISDVGYLDDILTDPYVSNVRTIACDADIEIPIFSYLNDDITLQSLTSDTKDFSYSKDLMLKSVETALGYDNAKLDLSEVSWPENDADHWENIYNDMSSSLKTYWSPFRAFERTTLTESDVRVRTFLNLHSESSREGDRITLNVKGADGQKCWFVLRTHGESIDSISGATYTEIETDAYLLEVTGDIVIIDVKKTKVIG